MPRWEMRIGLGQVIILWSVLAGIMVCVFLFGYHAGREQGWNKAVEEAGSHAMRLPVPQTIAQADAESGEQAGGAKLDELAGLNPERPSAHPTSVFSGVEPTPPEDELNFDFSQAKPVPSAEANAAKPPAAADGFAAQSAVDLAREAAAPAGTTTPAATAEQTAAAAPKPVVEKPTPAAAPSAAPSPKAAKPAAKPDAKADAKTAVAGISAPKEGWYVQVAATRALSDAKYLVNRFSQAGYGTAIEQATVHKRQYFRILVGPYGAQSGAESAQTELKRAKLVKGEPFLKRID